MSAFTQTELDYLLGERRLARVATVGPVGWSLNRAEEVIEVSGHDFASTKKFCEVAATGQPPSSSTMSPNPRGSPVPSAAAAAPTPSRTTVAPVSVSTPDRVISWGLE